MAARLLLGSAVATALALLIVLVLMHQVLTRFVTGQIDQRLDNKIVALASQVRVSAEGTLSLDGQADGPPFDKRRHHSFWMVQGPRNALMTGWLAPGELAVPSRAAVDEALARPAPPAPGPGGLDSHPRTLHGEAVDGVATHGRVTRIAIAGTEVTILAAAPRSAIDDPVGEAMARVGLGVLALGIVLGALAFAQVRLGLRPLATLRRQLADIGDGGRDLLPDAQPREVAPLVSEMNLLLTRHAANLEKARRNVANLAHGLRTPLATLQLGVDGPGGPDKGEMRLLLAQIDRHLRHHLGRARAAALWGPERSRTPLAPCLAGLGDALRRIHADRGIMLAIRCPPDLTLACEGNDLDEVFGNLLDNAFKFAASDVKCEAWRDGTDGIVEISDDGKGFGPEEAAIVLRPGQRLDEQVPGYGFGLAIVRELVELYGGDLRLGPGETGLRVTVRLPAASRHPPQPLALTTPEPADSGAISGAYAMPVRSRPKELPMDDGRMGEGGVDGGGTGTARPDAPGTGVRFGTLGSRRFGSAAFGSGRLRMGVAAALVAAAAVGAGAATLVLRGRTVTLVALAPQPVSALRDGAMAAVKGDVADVFGNKFVVQDASGRALVETGPRGEGANLVTRGETVVVQGRFERGFMHAAAITHAGGRVDAFGPPPPTRRGDADVGARERPPQPPS